ncbi:putative nuclease HARBI1 [Setaria italica]|uniref:putative nuclease HARBI1 n=1 Tax=Setaria italica TaxID=4555 RepID=UPI000BE61682|nr:putative nuclease HARBI1 [Setaria italica]
MSSAEEQNSDTGSDSSSVFDLKCLGGAAAAYAELRGIHRPGRNPPVDLPCLTGRQWVELNLRDRRRCFDNFRMYPDTFLQLHDMLVSKHGLKTSQGVESVEALAMFVWVCATQQACCQIRERFDRSLDTVSRKMAHVANVMYSFAQEVIAPKDPAYSKVNHKLTQYAPFFDGCIGALDGTHIPVLVGRESCVDFLNRKGWTSFNVLAICDMDMRFTYVGAGMAGSCHDMAVLRDCMAARTYPHPPAGRYYLVDSGYAVREGYLGPYRNTRYHLEEFSRRAADTLEEKFNFHHSSLRNVVERAFGVLKFRWHILREVPLYS